MADWETYVGVGLALGSVAVHIGVSLNKLAVIKEAIKEIKSNQKESAQRQGARIEDMGKDIAVLWERVGGRPRRQTRSHQAVPEKIEDEGSDDDGS